MKKIYSCLSLAFAAAIANAQPANDNCANATQLNVGNICVSTAGTVVGSTASSPPTACWGSSTLDVWYKFTAVTGMEVIELQCSSSFYGVEELMTTCNGPSLRCMGSGPGLDDTIKTNTLIPGNTYYIRVYDYWNPSPTQTFNICVWVSTSTGISNPTAENVIKLFPNPGSGAFTLETSVINSQLVISNVLGEKIYEQKIILETSEVNLTDLPGGVYFAHILRNNEIIGTEKLIIAGR